MQLEYRGLAYTVDLCTATTTELGGTGNYRGNAVRFRTAQPISQSMHPATLMWRGNCYPGTR